MSAHGEPDDPIFWLIRLDGLQFAETGLRFSFVRIRVLPSELQQSNDGQPVLLNRPDDRDSVAFVVRKCDRVSLYRNRLAIAR